MNKLDSVIDMSPLTNYRHVALCNHTSVYIYTACQRLSCSVNSVISNLCLAKKTQFAKRKGASSKYDRLF